MERPVETATDTLEIQDSRTDKTYNIPIADGAIRASDLKQVKTERRGRSRADDVRSRRS